MIGRSHVVVALVCFGVPAIIFALILWRCFYHKKQTEIHNKPNSDNTTVNFQAGINRLHHPDQSLRLHHHQVVDLDSKRATSPYKFRRGISSGKPLFSWAEHPSLIADAVENGWSRFGFNGYMSYPSTRSRLLGSCAVGDLKREAEAEISWEVCQGSADFMQKIRLNPGLKKVLFNNVGNSSLSAASVIRTALPLPGPSLGTNSSFPQEAYFEITILYCLGHEYESIGKVKEGEKTKLIQQNSNVKVNSESLVHYDNNSLKFNKAEEIKLNSTKDEGKGEGVMLSVGLTSGGSLPLKIPGSYTGSIGFCSNGSVYLDGTKLVFESEKSEWGRTDKVIGCGFDPRQKKVFFTVDSELIHVVHCKTEEYGSPLYPTLAANIDTMVLVNFGQSAFKYAAANSQRTQNPCFVGPIVNSPAALGYEDSRELFSMGRIDAQWLNRSTTKGNQNTGTINRALDFEEESEADLFEIVLDSCGRSPNIIS